MILILRVDDLLRGAMTPPSRHLVTRPTGALVRDRIERAIAATASPTTWLDFTDIGLMDFSCADEVVAKLLRAAGAGRYLALRGLDDTHAEAIDHVLERQDLSIAGLERAGAWRVLGRVTPDLLSAFAAVYAGGSGNADRLSSRLGWTLERTADALERLALRRLVLAAAGTFTPLPLPLQ